ncbi:MAG: super-infection exclusion protein B [Nitrosomonas sp.]|nr:super-infection exclusion protein B [Nitrosomonas sp.]
MIDANWINALKLPTKVLIGLFVASITLLLFDREEILALSTFSAIAKPAIILVCVVTGALSITSIISYFIEMYGSSRKRTLLEQRRELRKAEEEKQISIQKQEVIERIPYLSNAELRYLANCLRENSQSFTAYVYSPSASTLMSKGLIYTPGGTYNRDNYPFIVNDFVWRHLLEIKEQILAKDEENRRVEAEKK